MKISSWCLCALLACFVVVTACSQAPELSRARYIPNTDDVPAGRSSPPSYQLLYTFGKPPDGTGPGASLLDVRGALYGTTERGGTLDAGTVFKLTGGTTYSVLHSFGTGTDAAGPRAPLTNVRGTLYGTTIGGGTYGNMGTVFSISTAGTETVLHSFGNGADGSNPSGGMLDVDGKLYGTTMFGGTYRRGTVFSITQGGIEKVLYSFGYGTDGSYPTASLINVGGTLYGTTADGGAYDINSGTVFSITTRGVEHVLHSFGHDTDGSTPTAGLTNVGGVLYGTTAGGGTYCIRRGETCGTVFSVTTGGIEKVLHDFGYNADGAFPHGDGAFPLAGLINVKGTLYGATVAGGTYGNGGTIFSITTAGTETVLHSFGKGRDGRRPLAAMIYKGGNLVGTTYSGGLYGYGTVFSLKP